MSAVDLPRYRLASHPWSLSGGGAEGLVHQLNKKSVRMDLVRVGFYGDTHADEVFTLPSTIANKAVPREMAARTSYRGDQTRDWAFDGFDLTFHPYHESHTLRARMISEQEELDWDVYRRYGLLSDAEAVEVLGDGSTEPLGLGERTFEIVLARQVAAGNAETQWFARHGSTPITELPAHWSESYRKTVEARIALIERRRDLALIERPERKRRWATEPWEKQQERALRNWLLDRLEARHLWFAVDDNGDDQPVPHTVRPTGHQRFSMS